MAKATFGGRNKSVLYRLKFDDATQTYKVYDRLTDTEATTPTEANAALKLLGLIGSSKPTFQDDGTVQVTFDQYQCDEDFWGFLNKVAVASSAAMPEVKCEDGNKFGGGSTSEAILLISYLHYDNPDAPTKVFTVIAIGSIKASSGSFETKADDWTKPSFEFVGTKAKANISIETGMFDATIVNVTAGETLAKDKGYIRKYLTKAP